VKWGPIAALAVGSGVCLGTGCLEDNKDACGKGQKFENKSCVPAPSAGDGDGDGDADAGTDASTDSGPVCHPSADLFGSECTSDDECSTDAPYCAIQPTATKGYCTAIGCLDDPCVCPDQWECFDLSIFREDLPAMCEKP
jgi:hypothetical protein